jgi:hypothetical protein
MSILILHFSQIEGQKIHTYREFSYTEEEVRTKVYSTYKTPEGFYQDRLERGDKIHDSIYYHRQLKGGNWTFYSTDDYFEARAHVENEIMNSNVENKVISEIYENEKYFEFKTEETRTNGHTYILRHRVHKSSYIYLIENVRVKIWRQTNETSPIEIGTFIQRPIDESSSKELIEYLWFISNYNHYGAKVLDKKQSSNDQNIFYTSLETAFVGGDWGMHDVIYLTYSNYSINKTSGEIALMQEVFREIQGKYHPNSFFMPIECLFLPLTLFFILLVFGLWRKRKIKPTKGNEDSYNHHNGDSKAR